MSSDEINKLFWLNYGQTIKSKANVNLGQWGAFFLASEAQKCPLAGDGVPDEYTNQGLYDICSSVLAADNLFYKPAAGPGYVDALGKFLNWIKLDNGGNRYLEQRLLEAIKDQETYQEINNRERSGARERERMEEQMGLGPRMGMPDFMRDRDPRAMQAGMGAAQSSSQVEQIQLQIAGPLGAGIRDDRSKLATGRNDQKDFPGYNMKGTKSDRPAFKELLQRYNSGQGIDSPQAERIPLYNAPSYKQAVQAAMKKAGGDYKPENSASFTVDTGKKTSEFNFGFGERKIDATGWFSFKTGRDGFLSTLSTTDETSKINVKITYDTIQIINITPGSWHFDITKYKLRDDAPQNLKTLARITQFILVTGLGFEITFGSSQASEIDNKLREFKSFGGSISVFGVTVNYTNNDRGVSDDSLYTATWDNGSKIFTVKPARNGGFASVVGVVGEKGDLIDDLKRSGWYVWGTILSIFPIFTESSSHWVLMYPPKPRVWYIFMVPSFK